MHNTYTQTDIRRNIHTYIHNIHRYIQTYIHILQTQERSNLTGNLTEFFNLEMSEATRLVNLDMTETALEQRAFEFYKTRLLLGNSKKFTESSRSCKCTETAYFFVE